MFSRFDTVHECDRQTDRQMTDGQKRRSAVINSDIASRGKNNNVSVYVIVVGVFCPKAGSFSLTPSFSVMCLFFQLCVINRTLFIFLHQFIQ